MTSNLFGSSFSLVTHYKDVVSSSHASGMPSWLNEVMTNGRLFFLLLCEVIQKTPRRDGTCQWIIFLFGFKVYIFLKGLPLTTWIKLSWLYACTHNLSSSLQVWWAKVNTFELLDVLCAQEEYGEPLSWQVWSLIFFDKCSSSTPNLNL